MMANRSTTPRVYVVLRTMLLPLAARCGAQMLCLGLLMACASTGAHGQAPQAARICPPGTYDYGDGMVASLLSEQATEALVQAHERALKSAGSDISSFLAEQPWRPHVSVIYGVSTDREPLTYRVLQTFADEHDATMSCFGKLQYWDDDAGDKTTLILQVEEPAALLNSLHDALANEAHIRSRFAYHPHVTVAYLRAHRRLSPEKEEAILAPVNGVCWSNDIFYLTDPCGQELHRVRFRAAKL